MNVGCYKVKVQASIKMAYTMSVVGKFTRNFFVARSYLTNKIVL